MSVTCASSRFRHDANVLHTREEPRTDMVCVTMHACLRVLLVSWVVAILVDDVAALAQQSPARQSTTALRDPVSGRHRRHRSDKAKLLRNFLKKNGRLEGMIRLVDGPHAHIGNNSVDQVQSASFTCPSKQLAFVSFLLSG